MAFFLVTFPCFLMSSYSTRRATLSLSIVIKKTKSSPRTSNWLVNKLRLSQWRLVRKVGALASSGVFRDFQKSPSPCSILASQIALLAQWAILPWNSRGRLVASLDFHYVLGQDSLLSQCLSVPMQLYKSVGTGVNCLSDMGHLTRRRRSTICGYDTISHFLIYSSNTYPLTPYSLYRLVYWMQSFRSPDQKQISLIDLYTFLTAIIGRICWNRRAIILNARISYQLVQAFEAQCINLVTVSYLAPCKYPVLLKLFSRKHIAYRENHP